MDRENRILVLTSLYQPMLNDYFSKKNNISKTYDKNILDLNKLANNSSFFWSYNLNKIKNCKSKYIVLNSKDLQIKWAKENKVDYINWYEDILINQINFFKPKYIFVNNFNILSSSLILKIRSMFPYIDKLSVWDGIGVRDLNLFKNYDIVFSPLHYLVDYYNKNNIKSFHLPLAFDEQVLNWFDSSKKDIEISFIGSIHLFKEGHFNRLDFIYNLYKKYKISLFIAGSNNIRQYLVTIIRCFLQLNFKGLYRLMFLYYKSKKPKIGIEMLSTLSRSKITINNHIDIAKNEAANLRLYEATGVGSCLLTDEKSNLSEYFEINQEIMTYNSVDDCINKIKFLINNPKKLNEVSKSGMKRTLNEHTYKLRSQKMLNCLIND